MMRRLLLLLALVPGVAQAGAFQYLTQSASDALYLPFTGGTLSGALTLDDDLITSTGIINSTVADGVAGLVIDVVNPHATGNILEVREAGAAAVFRISAAGATTAAMTFTAVGSLNANNLIRNNGSASGCTDSGDELCVKDDLKIDGQLYLEENTTCTPIADYGCITTKSDNKVYFTTGDGVEEEFVLTGAGAFTAQMSDEANTDAYTVNAQINAHAYHTNGLAGFHLSNWTFDAGGEGAPHAITAIADYDGTWIEVTTGDAHGLEVGDIVSQVNLADVAYEGVFVVQAVPDTTHYRVIATYTATDTGTMDQAATLIAGTGAAGEYLVTWSASATTATNNETFDYSICIGATPAAGTQVRRKFGTAADYGSMSGTAILTIADGDPVSFILHNDDSSGNTTIRNLTLVLDRL